MLHGGPGLYDYFDDLAGLIDDTVEVHRYDQRGGGRSEPTPPYDIATFVADLDALREHWGHDRWTVLGHSWGESLALAYAMQHLQRVSALVLISGTGVIEDWRGEYHQNVATLLGPERVKRLRELRELKAGVTADWTQEMNREYCTLTWSADYADREHGEALAARLLRPYGPSYDVNEQLNAGWTRYLRDQEAAKRTQMIEVPALVIHGERDPRPGRLAERLAASLPNAQLAIVPDAGHLPWVEQPGRVGDVIRAFLPEVEQRVTSAP